MSNVQTYSIFPSLITEIKCSNFELYQKDLIKWIDDYKLKHESDGVVISNDGGWQSKSDFYSDKTFESFLNYIIQNLKEGIEKILQSNSSVKLNNMWINVNNKNDHNFLHTHGGVDFSGVFWIKIPKNSGDFIFNSPHEFQEYRMHKSILPSIASKFNLYSQYYLTPTEGMMVIFPSHIYHRVSKNLSHYNRISISFNLDIL